MEIREEYWVIVEEICRGYDDRVRSREDREDLAQEGVCVLLECVRDWGNADKGDNDAEFRKYVVGRVVSALEAIVATEEYIRKHTVPLAQR